MKNYILLLSFLFSITVYGQQSKGNRTLAYQVDLAEKGNYDSSLLYAIDACMESVHLFFTWNDLESDTGNFNQSFITGFLDLIDFYYPAYNLEVELQMATINTVSRTLPNGLDTVNFSDPLMISYFKRALDTVFSHLPNLKLSALTIGNETDVYWGIDSLQYVDYSIFIDSIRVYAKQKYFALHGEDLNIGVTLTHHSLVDPYLSNLCKIVNNKTDIVSTTYYPLESNFTMKPPSAVFTDFQELVTAYPDTNQPIYFAECGYSSSDVCNSSEALQAQFYENVFDAWDTYQSNIKYLTIFKTNDWSHAEVAALVPYYGISDTAFYEYLRTLGIRTYPGNGTNKLAYETIKCELNTRNWCATSCNQSTSMNNLNETNISIYPNPTSNELTIKSTTAVQTIQLMDVTGKVVLSSSEHSIQLTELISGTYFVTLFLSDGKIHQQKIVKL